jgi:hypothetical protein
VENELKPWLYKKENGAPNIPPQGATKYRCQYFFRFLWWEWQCKQDATAFCRYFCFGIFCVDHIEIHRLECMDKERKQEDYDSAR